MERMLLLDRSLERAATTYPDHAQVVAALRSILRSSESDNDWALVHDAHSRLSSGSSRYPEQDLNGAFSVLQNASAQTIRLHQYLSLLPAEKASSTVHSVLSRSYPSDYERLQPTILLLPDLAYYEFNLRTWVNDDSIFPTFVSPPDMQGAIIRLSGPDAHSPLSWAILAHEFAHEIVNSSALSESVARIEKKKLPVPNEIATAIYREFLADGLAALVMGPSSILALVRFEWMLLPLQGFMPVTDTNHPSTSARIRFIRDLLEPTVTSAFAETFEEYERYTRYVVEERLPGVVDPGALAASTWIERTILPSLHQEALKTISELGLDRFGSVHLERSQRLESRIARGIPPSAVRWASKARIRPRIMSAIEARDQDAFQAYLPFLGEEPGTPAEILTAGYLHRQSTWHNVVSTVLTQWEEDLDWSENMRPLLEVLSTDSMISHAVETAEVHSYILDAAWKSGEAPPVPITRLEEDLREEPMRPQAAATLLGDVHIVYELITAADDRLFVTPLVDASKQLGPASLDVRLGTNALIITNVNIESLDPLRGEETCRAELSAYTRHYRILPKDPLILHPGEFALAATLEYIRIPTHLAGRLEGRSSYGRAGLLVHATAGFIDPGYEGTVTFELMNHGKAPIVLYPGARIGQLCFFPSDALILYSMKREKKYQGALETLASQFFRDIEYRWYASPLPE